MISYESWQSIIAFNAAAYLQLIRGIPAGAVAANYQACAFANVNASLSWLQWQPVVIFFGGSGKQYATDPHRSVALTPIASPVACPA